MMTGKENQNEHVARTVAKIGGVYGFALVRQGLFVDYLLRLVGW